MRIADTSALVGLFVAQDEHHRAARRAFQDPSPIVVPAEVLQETVMLLRHRYGAAKAVAAGAALWHLGNTEVQGSDAEVLMAAWGEFEAAPAQLSYPDCVVIAWCRAHRATPLAYDRDLLRALRA